MFEKRIAFEKRAENRKNENDRVADECRREKGWGGRRGEGKRGREIVVHAYDRRDWSGRSIKRESVVRESFSAVLQGARTWAMAVHGEIDYYCRCASGRRIGVPCYRVMSLLFKNHAGVTCAAINYNNVI